MGNTRKLYGYALQAYKELIANGLEPNQYTFANLMNACARASEVDTAREFFSEMDRYSIPKDEIIYTILMKTYCNAGRVHEAVAVLAEMKEAGLKPNVRSFQTLIRECMHSCDLDLAQQVVDHMSKFGIKPTAVVLEHLCRLHAMRLDVAPALERLNELEDLMLQNEQNEQVFHVETLPVSVATCAAAIAHANFLLNDIRAGRKTLAQARAAVDRVRKRNGARTLTWWESKDKSRGKGKFRVDEAEPAPVADKDSSDKDKPRVEWERDQEFTTKQFSGMREQEVETEVRRLEAYVKSVATAQQTVPANVERDEKTSGWQWRATGVLKRGLTEQHRVFRIPAASPPEKPMDWERIFRNQQPLRVEVCSGAGEWICERARKFPNINWIAVEMSPERVFQIWSRSQLMHLKNLVVVCGEATQVLTHCFVRGGIQQLYVNFPEPPVWSGWVFRLLKEDFFEAAHRSLVRGRRVKKGSDEDEFEDKVGDVGQGFITILTDDPGYVWTLARELAEGGRSGHLFKTGLPTNELFMCDVPENYGNSYYDRFFDHGNKKRRYYMKLLKVKQ
jgi:pentatricopeptide repeat protein